jgi:CRISPR/Cas system-associated exonuclease Cas4 (RecB family)
MGDKKWRGIWDDLRTKIFSIYENEWNQIGKNKNYEDCFESEEQKKNMHDESEEFLDFFVAKLSYSLSQKIKELDKKSEWFETNIKRHFYPKDRETEIVIEEENIRGVMDKTIGLSNNGVAIQDYKTSKTTLPHFIAGSDLKQAKVYAYMWKVKFGVLPKFVSIFYIKDGESVYYPITERDFEEVKKDIQEIRSKEAMKPQFPKHVTPLCKSCSFFSLCFRSELQFMEEMSRTT